MSRVEWRITAEIDELITLWLTQQVGTWRVQQRIWSSATAEPVVLPPMVAERRMLHDVFLEESMQPAAGSGQKPFTRIAYVSFNPVNRHGVRLHTAVVARSQTLT